MIPDPYLEELRQSLAARAESVCRELLPGGKRVAVIFNIAFEAWSDGQAPGIGPMGNVLKPGNTFSVFTI